MPIQTYESRTTPVAADYVPNEREEKFLEGLVEFGMTAQKAYEYAGYRPDKSSALRKAKRLAPLIARSVQSRLVSHAPVALKTVYDIMTDENTSPNIRLTAAKEWLDRSGFSKTLEMRITEGEKAIDEMSEEELAVRAQRLMSKMSSREMRELSRRPVEVVSDAEIVEDE